VPTHRIAFVKDGPKRLVVKRLLFSPVTTVLLDGNEIGRFETRAELSEGRTYPLDDGTKLRVVLDPARPAMLWGEPAKLRVERDGALLRGSPAHPAQTVAVGGAILSLVGVFLVVLGLLTMLTGGFGSNAAGGAIGLQLEGLLYLGLAYAARREKRWALILGLCLYLLDTVVAIASTSAAGWGVRIVFIFSLARAIRAHPQLAHVDAASTAEVFR
jgi:hypothetical protein